MSWARLFFSPVGRIGRRAFWIGEGVFLAILAAALLAEAAAPPVGGVERPVVLAALLAMA